MKLHLFSLFLLILSCTPKNESANDVVLFEPLLISTAAPEFSFTINADNNLLFFNRTNEDRSTIKIMMSKLVDDKWQAAEELSFSNGKYRDVDPFLAHDGKRLYFSSTRPVTEGGSEKDFDTWYVEKAENGWSEPINPGAPLNSDSTEIFFTMSKNGNAYFASEFDGQRGIAFSRFKDGAYQPMERITLRLNGVAVEAGNPCIASDESFLIVALRTAKRSPNLYISFNQTDKWSELIKLPEPINSEFTDFAPALSKDNRFLYFTSERPGIVPALNDDSRPPGDIYMIALNIDQF